uniref:DC-STAMP domain containing 1 n=1 Tax=Pygocentrus nattereri TaxID=42514 RepID=A0AAR2JT42_PYGNA
MTKIVILATDGILYHIFNIIRRHTFTEYSLSSSHDIHIDVDGESMLAKLLRKTIGAFNTSSKLDMQSSNQQCLPQPRALSQTDYLWSILPLLLMGLMCCLQVYTNRLRRVITTFYFPKVTQQTFTDKKRRKAEMFMKGNINASADQEILDNFILPTLWEQFGDGPFLFQHDCAPVHKARSIKTWILRARPSHPTSVSDLTSVLLEES